MSRDCRLTPVESAPPRAVPRLAWDCAVLLPLNSFPGEGHRGMAQRCRPDALFFSAVATPGWVRRIVPGDPELQWERRRCPRPRPRRLLQALLPAGALLAAAAWLSLPCPGALALAAADAAPDALAAAALVEECGGNLTAPRGVIHSPNFPGRFRVPLRCRWVIDASAYTKPLIIVYLTQVYVLNGLNFYAYALYGRSRMGETKIFLELENNNLTMTQVHSVDPSNVTTSHWLSSKYPYLVVDLALDRLEGNHLRVQSHLQDVFGFNLTYEVREEDPTSPASPCNGTFCCNTLQCSFVGDCFVDAEYNPRPNLGLEEEEGKVEDDEDDEEEEEEGDAEGGRRSRATCCGPSVFDVCLRLVCCRNFWCACPAGHDGPDCGLGPKCRDDPAICKNGGTCKSLGTESIVCACLDGYSGAFCEIPPVDEEDRGEYGSERRVLEWCPGGLCSAASTPFTPGRTLLPSPPLRSPLVMPAELLAMASPRRAAPRRLVGQVTTKS
ncbi:CUB and sushi domain-containing protein 2 [Frankliniella fusca]|uniref:CUB and sushi domain-containing protein 2 n=1 Tax=Frankliniella fusca TaxID=407009 RepID=A0AAE1LEY9_9NEOP|nr:CUB and sushi domain-containing protein 2 [Frankliniella fusca]